MELDILYKIKNNKKHYDYLRTHSYWYKYLNRSEIYYKDFINDMKDKYKLKPTDRINKMMDNINMIASFLDVLK